MERQLGAREPAKSRETIATKGAVTRHQGFFIYIYKLSGTLQIKKKGGVVARECQVRMRPWRQTHQFIINDWFGNNEWSIVISSLPSL